MRRDHPRYHLCDRCIVGCSKQICQRVADAACTFAGLAWYVLGLLLCVAIAIHVILERAPIVAREVLG